MRGRFNTNENSKSYLDIKKEYERRKKRNGNFKPKKQNGFNFNLDKILEKIKESFKGNSSQRKNKKNNMKIIIISVIAILLIVIFSTIMIYNRKFKIC